MDENFSNYVIYVDESGDHSLTSVNPDYPIFALAFCVFNKEKYSDTQILRLRKYSNLSLSILVMI